LVPIDQKGIFILSDAKIKIRCRRCKQAYYKSTGGLNTCPYCAKDALIPNGTIAVLRMNIRPGGYSDKNLRLEAGLGSKAKSGAIYLRSTVTVVAGPQQDKKFTAPIGIFSEKSDFWSHKGRELIREILNSSQGLSSSDNSRKAVFGRIIDNYSILNSIYFVGVVGIRKSQNGREENNISRVLSGDDEEYKELVTGKKFIPTLKVPPRSEPSSAMWRLT
jgi:hypothetical protein